MFSPHRYFVFLFLLIFNLLPTWGKALCWISDSFSLCIEIMQFSVSEVLTFCKRSLGEAHGLAQAYVIKKAFSGAHCVWHGAWFVWGIGFLRHSSSPTTYPMCGRPGCPLHTDLAYQPSIVSVLGENVYKVCINNPLGNCSCFPFPPNFCRRDQSNKQRKILKKWQAGPVAGHRVPNDKVTGSIPT